jgi:hypothetical protein
MKNNATSRLDNDFVGFVYSTLCKTLEDNKGWQSTTF